MHFASQGHVSRRRLFVVAPAAFAAAALPSRISAGAATTDLAVTCDAAAGPAVIAAAQAYRGKAGVRVRVFPTAPGLVLPQIQREIQNDIVVAQIATIEQAEKQGLVAPGAPTGPWRNRLVTAAAKAPTGPEGSFAVPDQSPASDIDGIAILHRLGVSPAKATPKYYRFRYVPFPHRHGTACPGHLFPHMPRKVARTSRAMTK